MLQLHTRLNIQLSTRCRNRSQFIRLRAFQWTLLLYQISQIYKSLNSSICC